MAKASTPAAPPQGGGEPGLKSNRLGYDDIKAKFESIAELEDQIATLRGRVANEWKAIEDGGINRIVAKQIHRMRTKSAATLQAEEEERRTLFDMFIKPRIEEAANGQNDE